MMHDTVERFLTAAVLVTGMYTGTPALGQTAALPSVAPVAKWAVKVGPGRCTLSRTAGDDGTHSGIALDTFVGTDAYRFSMAGLDMIEHAAGEAFPITIAFHDADRQFNRDGMSALLGKNMRADSVSGLGSDFVDAFAQSSAVSLQSKSRTTPPFPLPHAKTAIQAFDQCMTDQLLEWGADPAQFAPGGKKPTALSDRDHWLASRDLLAMAEIKNVIDARFQVTVGPDGRVDTCKRIDSDAKDGMERIACNAVKSKQLFTPASGPDGKPVRGAAAFAVYLVKQANLR